MPRKKTERPIQIHFRVTQKEHEIIKNKVEQSGLSMSEFARKTFLDKKIVSAPPADFPALVREIKRVGGNLNQLVRKLNTLGIAHSLELENCENEIREAERMLYRTFRPGKGDN